MRCVVTGAAGFIGSHLVERLVDDGHSVVGIDSFSDFYDPALKRANLAGLREHPRFELEACDLAGADLDSALDGADVVFHLAGRPGVQTSWGRGMAACVRDNVEATRRVLDAAAACGTRVVLASSSSVYGRAVRFPIREDDPVRPVSPYGLTKLAAERAAAASAAEVVVLRYFSVFGARQRPDMAFARFAAAITAGLPVTVNGDGRQVRDFTAVDDVVAATVAAASRAGPGRPYNVAGGCAVGVLEALDLIGGMLGRAPRVVHGPALPGDPERTQADTSRAREELGWAPRVRLPDGLAAQLGGDRLPAAA